MSLKDIKENALSEYVPIVRDETAKALVSALKISKAKSILEIGGATGYSAILMSDAMNDDCEIISLEKDEDRLKKAKQNVSSVGKDNIKFILCDAIEYLKECKEKFDFIFLDGPKGQYKNYLPHINEILNEGGVLFSDNVNFKGYVLNTEVEPIRKYRSLVNSLREFLKMLDSDENYETKVYDEEDGYSISRRLK